MIRTYLPAFIALILLSGPVNAGPSHISPSSEGAVAYIISPANGEAVSGTFTVKFGLRGMGVAPAGVERPGTGHHHLLIDAKGLPEAGKPMGGDIRHFGGGQTEAEIQLSPGMHTLQLVLGNHLHVPHAPIVFSEPITIFVR